MVKKNKAQYFAGFSATMTLLQRLSFRKQLFLFLTAGILIMLGFTSYTQYKTAESSLRKIQIDQGIKLSQTFASQSVLALIYDAKSNAEESIKSILEFSDVVAVEIFRVDETELLFAGESSFRLDRTLPMLETSGLQYESEKSWYFVAPVIQVSEIVTPFDDTEEGNEVIGYVRLTISKETLNQNAKEHLINNLSTSVLLGIIFIVLAMFLLAQLTRPIRNLANSMRRVEEGHRDVRATIEGPSDVQRIIGAFNQMVETRESEEQKIKEAHDLAVEVAKMKGDFAANVSHELRTPMNGIMGMVDIMRSSGDISPKQSEYLEVIHTSSSNLLELINDILDFTKIDSGKVKLVKEDFYLEDCIQTVLDLLAGQAQRKDIELGLIIDENAPDLINGDAGRIRQVLINLVGNAIKFTDDGEIIIRVEYLQASEDTVRYKFSVEDSGIGIDKEKWEKIYQPFQQIDSSSSSKYGGTGLGLTITKQLVDLMGGELGVDSELGKGSTFWFIVDFDSAKNETKYFVEKHRPDVAGLRVLLVNDSVVSRHSIATILKNWDAYQQSAPTGHAALNKLKQAANKSRSYDFIIIDQQMRSMNYVDLVSRIRKDPALSATRVIMTINSNAIGKTEAIRKGVDGVIQKPVRDIKLYQCMTSIMNSQSATSIYEKPGKELFQFKRHVLICEDTKTNVFVAREILIKLGCSVDVAENGQDAVDNYRSNNYDLILMDCRMPVMDGYEATGIYRSRELKGTRTPIIAMTANTDKDDRQHCLDAGMDDYLPKPLSIESVKEMIIKWANNPDEVNAHKFNNNAAIPEVPLNSTNEEEIDDIHEISDFQFAKNINSATFSNLLDSLGSETVIKMLNAFLDELPQSLRSITRAIDSQDRKTLVDVAHSLKSSSQNFGCDEFSQIARDIELTSSSIQFEQLQKKVNTLNEKAKSLKFELEKIKNVESSRIAAEMEYNILIVDDSVSQQIALSNSLSNNKISVSIAKNGSEAIAFCQRKLPDLILLDALMPEKSNPEMDGFVACQIIKQLPGAQNMPVLMVTALDDEMSVNKAMDSGASDYITKPVNYGVLQSRVNQLLISSHSERQLQKVAYTDALTGLPNRAYFIDRVATTIRERDKALNIAVLFVGLNQFKLVNDGFGHEIGDSLLQSVAKRLKSLCDDRSVVARTGGDEFSFVIKTDDPLYELKSFSENIRYEISLPFYIQGETLHMSACVGISICPKNGTDLSLLMKCADTAMFYAKESNEGYCFFDDQMAEKATRRLKILSGLSDAIINEELFLNYQPQFSVEKQTIIGCEALVRWNSKHHDIIYPDEFIPYAEESGIIIELGEWVILAACKQLKKWEDDGFKEFKMAINLSGRQIEQQNLPERVAEILNETGIQAERIEFEITESSLMSKPKETVKTMNELRDMGIDIAIDDFGTGYNTLTHLENYPISTIKIDKSFTDNINKENDKGPSVIQGIISFSKGLNYKVIAEGVENQMQRVFLEGLGCDCLQGYLIGKPMAGSIFEQTILRRRSISNNNLRRSVTPITKNKKV